MTPPISALRERGSLVFSHMGFYVRDLERMAHFYKDVLCFTETDRGDLGAVQLVFLSRDPAEHHQVVLASGRPADLTFSVINQISLRVPDLATLRLVRDRVAADADVTEMLCATHGNAVSIYFRDPEGNRLEVFMDMPWYCEQPLREPIDLDQSDEIIMARAEAIARSRPKFQSRALWQADMARRMGYADDSQEA
ncbi:glyoxalase/bleomycin resistance protein/dioxygenase superfamily protein [Acidovorax sp. 69]|uniref:VOC family protein n=1 Tax=Acidovorax sp. 69 TaxID=2035202 RepID=UPI000C24F72D|nr:VOC family protein [Acidovorax sp. 69]PJI97721.1 glyoxalase/bleomycin resistance protein/dioxygenase superfamily protein [Acidovorax sp. 69]